LGSSFVTDAADTDVAASPGTGRDSTASSALRLQPDGTWSQWGVRDAVEDYFVGLSRTSVGDYLGDQGFLLPSRVVMLPGGHGSGAGALAFPVVGAGEFQVPPVSFDPGLGRWVALPTPFAVSDFENQGSQNFLLDGVTAVAPDNQGGAWLSVMGAIGDDDGGYNELGNLMPIQFYHYTDTVHQPVFADVAHPIRQEMTAATGGPDGSFWVATASGTVYRYDRVTGWNRIAIQGWNAALAPVSSPAFAIAVGASGQGVVVGSQGRIADLSPTGVRLDEAVGRLCNLGVGAPCSTAHTLRAAAVAPDGSALVGGDRHTLLWRPSGGSFRLISPPRWGRPRRSPRWHWRALIALGWPPMTGGSSPARCQAMGLPGRPSCQGRRRMSTRGMRGSACRQAGSWPSGPWLSMRMVADTR
jgi:hypothetical protein